MFCVKNGFSMLLWFYWVLVVSALAEDLSLGHRVLDHFNIDPNYSNVNHGSYGAVPKVVTSKWLEWELLMERNPDQFLRYDVYGLMNAVRDTMANYLKTNSSNLVFVPNASNGVNAVFRSITVPKGRKILYLNIAYDMVKNTFQYISNVSHEDVMMVNISLPTSAEKILAKVEQALKTNDIHIASFSHIASTPAIVLPIQQLASLCLKYGSLIFVDGAHSLGQIPLNLDELKVDFWVGNGHKWLFSPKGSAVLYVSPHNQVLVEPTAINWEGQGITHFQAAFSYTGTTSYSAYLAMAEALAFREYLGGDKVIMEYMHTLAISVAGHVSEIWSTEPLHSDESMYAAMVVSS